MNTYAAIYRGKKAEILAETAYEAQLKASTMFKAKHPWDVSIILTKVGDRVVALLPLF